MVGFHSKTEQLLALKAFNEMGFVLLNLNQIAI